MSIQNFARLAEPIVELTREKMKKYSEVKWYQWHRKFLLVINNKLLTAPVLIYPGFSKEFLIKTDTFYVGLGTVLTQEY